MPGRPFIGLEGEWGGRVTEGNGRRWWCAMMVVEAAVLGGDRLGRWWGVMMGVLQPFREKEGVPGDAARAHTQGGGGNGGRSSRGGRRPGEALMSAKEGGAGWLGRPKAEAKWRVAMVAQWEGKGEWAGQGGRRGGPQLGRIQSRARIQKKFFSNFN
jgi:hypothetical protein